ncbi:unnamed protein product [Taenia asiatica]|uniref:Secreted protein n=1 Tax=Taenia asiatica TaxID=60517 RepID=A0A0R3W7X2_TAEAS|nr:unnamed protein product [Taenia asiatica]
MGVAVWCRGRSLLCGDKSRGEAAMAWGTIIAPPPPPALSRATPPRTSECANCGHKPMSVPPTCGAK